ncbi:hypothetical protein EsH8_VI_001196 [Colletotrichum jinshuiense]
MFSATKLMALLPLLLQASASPLANTASAANTTDVGIPLAQDGASTSRIDDQGRSRILLCSDANKSGTCINWGQKDHCWSFDDPALKIYNDAISSIYPLEGNGVTWTFWENYGCKGRALDGIVAPGINNLQDFNFNDIGSSLSWRLR